MHRSPLLAASLLLLVLFGCSDETITSVVPADARIGPYAASTPEVSLAPTLLRPTPPGCSGSAVSCKRDDDGDEFVSPLFGLATAPNGDVLVADAGSGIRTVDGRLEIGLARVTGVAPIGRSAAWATTTGEVGGEDTGQALHRVAAGRTRVVANLFEFENTHNPDGAQIDSNPFDVAATGGEWALVTDAAANSLLRVDDEGTIELVATFPAELVSTANFKALAGCPGSGADLCFLPPSIPAEPVPTSVVIGPDGYIYVGELKGFPAPTNASNVWRIAPGASGAVCGSSPDCEKVFSGGFTSIIDLAFGSDGTLYVAELDEQSWAAVEIFHNVSGGTVNACDVGAGTCTELATGIPILTAVTVGRDGGLWATTNALVPGAADVIPIP